MSNQLDKRIFKTHDEEWSPETRIATEVEKMLANLELDTVNSEYIVTVEVNKL